MKSQESVDFPESTEPEITTKKKEKIPLFSPDTHVKFLHLQAEVDSLLSEVHRVVCAKNQLKNTIH